MVVRAVASELKLDVVKCGPSVAEARSVEERHSSFHISSCPLIWNSTLKLCLTISFISSHFPE